MSVNMTKTVQFVQKKQGGQTGTYRAVKFADNTWANCFDQKVLVEAQKTYELVLEPRVWNGNTYYNLIGAKPVNPGPVSMPPPPPPPPSEAPAPEPEGPITLTEAQMLRVLTHISDMLVKAAAEQGGFFVIQ